MRIIKIKFQNFKKFSDMELTFDRPLTVLIGKNNSGKSSLLGGIAEMFNIPESLNSPLLAKQMGPTGTMIRQITYHLNDEEWKQAFQLAEYRFSDIKNEFNPEEVLPRLRESFIQYSTTSSYVDGQLPGGARQKWDLVGKHCLEDFENIQRQVIQHTLVHLSPGIMNVLGGVVYVSANRNTEQRERFVPFDELKSKQDSYKFVRNGLYYLKKKNVSEFNKMLERIKSIFPDINEIDVQHNEDTGFVEVKITENGITSDISEMGSGTKSLLLILARALSPNAKIVLLDEPDISMHPGLVKDFSKFLEELSERVQIIITSHHETFVNEIEVSNLFHVRSKDDNSSEIKPLKNEIQMETLLSDIGITNNFSHAEAASSKVIILGEGSSDWKYITEFARKLDLSNELLSLETYFHPLGGRRTIDAELLDKIHGSRQSFLLILDKDEYDESEINKIESKLGNDRVHILNQREIENYALEYNAIFKAIQNRNFQKSDISDLTIDELKSTIFELSQKLKSKVILLRFIRNMPFLKILSNREIHYFIEKNISKSIDDAVNAFVSDMFSKISTLQPSELITIAKKEEEEVNKIWNKDTILNICPAKDLLHEINLWLNEKYKIDISTKDLINELDEIDVDMKKLIQKIVSLK